MCLSSFISADHKDAGDAVSYTGCRGDRGRAGVHSRLAENSPFRLHCTGVPTHLRSDAFKEIIHIPVQFAFHLVLCGSKSVGEKEMEEQFVVI